MRKYSKYIFIVVSIFELFSQFDFLPFQSIHNFTKPMLMPALALYFYSNTTTLISNRLRYFVLLALFFAFWGDVFLMFVNKNTVFFLLGLGSFLVMQLLYINIFKLFNFNDLITKWPYTGLIVIIAIGLLFFLYPNLGEMKIPVFLYFSAILMMVLSALGFWKRDNESRIVFLGALLFMISDSLIAINKFKFELPLSGFLIMATYILAQWYIIEGLKNYLNNKFK
jgi:uncharacterized membrane protein YhhN